MLLPVVWISNREWKLNFAAENFVSYANIYKCILCKRYLQIINCNLNSCYSRFSRAGGRLWTSCLNLLTPQRITFNPRVPWLGLILSQVDILATVFTYTDSKAVAIPTGSCSESFKRLKVRKQVIWVSLYQISTVNEARHPDLERFILLSSIHRISNKSSSSRSHCFCHLCCSKKDGVPELILFSAVHTGSCLTTMPDSAKS